MSSITVCYTEIPQSLWQFETLRLLCDSRTHLLCFSYRPQCSSAVNRLHWHLHPSQRLLTTSASHPVVSSSPLAEPISGFWKLHYEPLEPYAFGTFHLSFHMCPQVVTKRLFRRYFRDLHFEDSLVSLLDSFL